MPYVGESFEHDLSALTNEKYKARLSANDSYQVYENSFKDVLVPINDESTSGYFDTGNNYNNSAYYYSAPNGRRQRFKGQVKITHEMFTLLGYAVTTNYSAYLKVTDSSGTLRFNIPFNQSSIQPLFSITTSGTTKNYDFDSGLIDLNAGDRVYLYVRSYGFNTGAASTPYAHKFSVAADTYIYNELDSTILKGHTITLKNILPNDVTALDVVRGVAHMFNLYFKTDNAMKIVYIEDRNTFFDDITTAKDWTHKLNKTDYKLEFIDDYKRDLVFRYDEDSNDGHVKARNENKAVQLGEYKHRLNDRFQIGEKKITNPTFAPTYHIMDRNVIGVYGIGGIVTMPRHKAPLISRMWKNWNADDAGQGNFYDFKPRILVKSYGTQTDDDGNNRSWYWEGASETNIPTALMRGYGDVTQANLSYNGSDGLFQTYYGLYVNVIEKGVLLTASFDLGVQDISEVDLKKPIYISAPSDLHGYYVINRVIDYSPSRNALTKVELVKIENQGKATFDSGQVGADRGGRDWGELGGSAGMAQVTNPWNAGSGGKFDDDDPVLGINSGGATAVLNNGTNYAKSGSNNVVFGEGNVALGRGQTVVGQYAEIDTTASFIVGNGTDPDNRQTVLKLDADNELVQYGGQIQAIINDVVQDVMVEDAENERYIKLFKS